ncbi:CRISPR-associated endonuclease Cas2 [Singulisphaera rosea]
MNSAKWWLVCYDVHDPNRLRRAAKVLEGSGSRMQESVFRCWMTPSQMHRLRWELTQVLEPNDEVLMIPLCPHCVSGMETTYSAQNPIAWPDSPESHRIL